MSFSAFADTSVIFRNANVFDGENEKLMMNTDVLVKDNMISAIGQDLSADGATVIDATDKTLIPGLIDVHWHTYYSYIPVSTLATGDMSEVAIAGFLDTEKNKQFLFFMLGFLENI